MGTLKDEVRPLLIVPYNFANALSVEAAGIELAADMKIRSWWKLATSYSYI